MQVLNDFPQRIEKKDHVWIPMRDGCRLSGRIWLPDQAEQIPVPAILEYIPYRKNDGTALRDSLIHPYFAGHGYASVRVDLRGSGDSEGILEDEYLKQELEDAIEVLEWISEQSWCNGNLGMMGKSWGGFNSLQIAALKSAPLKAIITVCSTDDRYVDDVHYMGGCVLATDMLGWASTMLAWNARPPDPEVWGHRWREEWLKRMHDTPAFIETWLKHQPRDGFWKHGSVCEDPSAIECAVFAIGGWADPYSNAIPRILEGLSCPRKGLIGPWAHEYPMRALPGPQIGFLQECLRWWDYWLKGKDTGIMNEPMLRAWVHESGTPGGIQKERKGRWIGETNWPSKNVSPFNCYLHQHGMTQQPQTESEVLIHQSPLDACAENGVWFPMGIDGDFPEDQRIADGQSLGFDMQPEDIPVEILGHPHLKLEISVNRPRALLAGRLCDVSPDGSSLLVSWGLFNLCHRNSHELPEDMELNQKTIVEFPLRATAHRLASGHHWRLSLSTSCFPHAWPSPEKVELRLYPGKNTFLTLPVRKEVLENENLTFEPAECSPPLETRFLKKANRNRTVLRNASNGRCILRDGNHSGRILFQDSGLEIEDSSLDKLEISLEDPLSMMTECKRISAVGRERWQTRVETKSKMTCDEKKFYLENQLEAFENDLRVFQKTWKTSIQRYFV
ncbi:MAG: CocE/NonD family hydrolase [SAR324 cluster bacterium]|jgi:hypothetical protein|nr:CocE/NonD family hydrolase [SAR324 cluster bacterium]|tara:strand:+ start:6122 stop:8143 length:2022 start_codon:yes stop_codon:yes gene_type:complete